MIEDTVALCLSRRYCTPVVFVVVGKGAKLDMDTRDVTLQVSRARSGAK